MKRMWHWKHLHAYRTKTMQTRVHEILHSQRCATFLQHQFVKHTKITDACFRICEQIWLQIYEDRSRRENGNRRSVISVHYLSCTTVSWGDLLEHHLPSLSFQQGQRVSVATHVPCSTHKYNYYFCPWLLGYYQCLFICFPDKCLRGHSSIVPPSSSWDSRLSVLLLAAGHTLIHTHQSVTLHHEQMGLSGSTRNKCVVTILTIIQKSRKLNLPTTSCLSRTSAQRLHNVSCCPWTHLHVCF